MKIIDIVRTGHVERWNLLRTHRYQTIGEHMYQVAMISQIVGKAIGLGPEDIKSVVIQALIHDLPEVITGDIPTPTKLLINSWPHPAGVSGPLNINDYLDDHYWADKFPVIREAFNVDGPLQWLLSIADLMEAILFLKIEGIGARASFINKQLRDRMLNLVEIGNRRWPELRWNECTKLLSNTISKIVDGDY